MSTKQSTKLTAKFIGVSTFPKSRAKLVFSTNDEPKIILTIPPGRSADEFLPLVGQSFVIGVSSRPYNYVDATGATRKGVSRRLTSMAPV